MGRGVPKSLKNPLSVKVDDLTKKTGLLKKLRKIRNEIKANGAYSNINQIAETNKIERLTSHTSDPDHKALVEREQQLFDREWRLKRKFVKLLLDDYESVLNEMEHYVEGQKEEEEPN